VGPDGQDVPDLTGRRALVTGATSDLGRAVVAVLAGRGAEVVLAGHRPDTLAGTVAGLRAAVPGVVLDILVVDLADQASVRRAAGEVTGPLHLLLAGAGAPAAPGARTPDGSQVQPAADLLGHFALTGLLLPRLVEGGKDGHGDARVVTVTSVGHRLVRGLPLGDPRERHGRDRPWQTWARTRLASLVLALELDRRAREAGLPLRALAADPGPAAPTADRGPGGILDAALSALGRPAAARALPLLLAATGDLPASTYAGPGGPGGLTGPPRALEPSRRALDAATGRRLWEAAERATGVRYPWLGSTPAP
jgi:NAD(P)-dependent dehydrogenase (short-subunit alcohol dehydrogenase family)